MIEDNSPFIVRKGDRVHFPIGLLVEKWLLYYYPLISIPQINKSTQLAFAGPMKEIVAFYELRGGFSVFYNDLKNKGIPVEIGQSFQDLVRKLAKTIIEMPMNWE